MKFSICLPVFDRSAKLVNALRTVARQTHHDLEVVVKDGCLEHPAVQDAEVEAIFRSLAPRVRYVLSPDGGIFPGLNEALRYATGDVLYIMNSDDELGDASTLESVAAVLGEVRGPAWVYGQMEIIDEEGGVLEVRGSPVDFWRLLERQDIPQPSVFWNRPMFERVGYFDERYAHSADYDYWLRCWKVSPGIYMPRILGRFRRWPGSHTTSNGKNQLRDARRISWEHWKHSIRDTGLWLTPDGIRHGFRRFRVRLVETLSFWWWGFLRMTGPIRHPLGLRQKKIANLLARIKLLWTGRVASKGV